MESHERRGTTAVDRRSKAGKGKAQETLSRVPLLADIGFSGCRDDSAEREEGTESEGQGEHGRSAGLGAHLAYRERSSVMDPSGTGTAASRDSTGTHAVAGANDRSRCPPERPGSRGQYRVTCPFSGAVSFAPNCQLGTTIAVPAELVLCNWQLGFSESALPSASTPLVRYMILHANVLHQGLSTPSQSQGVAPPVDCNRDVPAASSSHFDSADPSPVRAAQFMPPFMFVASHYATNNPEFSGFHFLPAPGDLSALAPPLADPGTHGGNDSDPQYHPHPQDFGTNPENHFESPPWTTDQIDEFIRNMQTESSFNYSSQPQQPNSHMNL